MFRLEPNDDLENDSGNANDLIAMLSGKAYEYGIGNTSPAFIGLMKYSVRATLTI